MSNEPRAADVAAGSVVHFVDVHLPRVQTGCALDVVRTAAGWCSNWRSVIPVESNIGEDGGLRIVPMASVSCPLCRPAARAHNELMGAT